MVIQQMGVKLAPKPSDHHIFKIMYASRKEEVMNLMKCFQLFPHKSISCAASDYLLCKVKKTELNLVVKIMRVSAAKPMRSSSIPL